MSLSIGNNIPQIAQQAPVSADQAGPANIPHHLLVQTAPEGNPLKSLGQAILTTMGLPASYLQAQFVVLVPVPGGLAIRLSKQAITAMDRMEREFGISFVDVSYRMLKKQAIVPLHRLPEIVERLGLNNSIVGEIRASSPIFSCYKIHASILPEDNQIRPLHTIALSLAHLDPAQHLILENFINPRAKPEEYGGLRIPLIEPTDAGLEIWFRKNSSPDLAELIAKTFMLTADPDGSFLTRPFGEYDKVLRVKRNDIESFLTLLGLDDITNVPGRINPAHGVKFFKDHLIALKKFHPYMPTVIDNDPIKSLTLSLENLIHQERGEEVTPLVLMHPILGLIIRLPNGNNGDGYSRRLINYLGYNSRPVSCKIGHHKYDVEIIVSIEEMKSFLKMMMLEQLEGGLLDKLGNLHRSIEDVWGKRFFPGGNVTELRVANTISRRLYALMSLDNANAVKRYTETARPETELPLPRVEFNDKKMTIFFPQEVDTNPLVEKTFFSSFMEMIGLNFQEEMADDSYPSLNNYIGAILGLDVKSCRESFWKDPKVYTSKIEVLYHQDLEKNRILQLLQRDLALRDLPQEVAFPFQVGQEHTGRVTCWDELLFGFSRQLNVPFLPYGRVNKEGLKLAPPTIDLPDNLPDYEDNVIFQTLEQTLSACGVSTRQKEGCRGQYSSLLDGIRPQDDSSKEAVKVTLRHFIYELRKEPAKCSQEEKKNAVISVGLGCASCFAGSQVRIGEGIKRVTGQSEY